MESSSKKEKHEHSLFWSPSVNWKRKDNKLQIEIFTYPEVFADIFPEFYFVTQDGATEEELLKKFSTIPERKMSNFIKNLVKQKILVNTILTPQEIFYKQLKLFQGEYDSEIMFDAQKLNAFKDRELHRRPVGAMGEKIQFKQNISYSNYISKRKTYRSFDCSQVIPFQVFLELISAYKQFIQNEEIRYYYASAGGLYPIDIYIYVKQGRVENVKQGLYYYSPVENAIFMVNENADITADAHFYSNASIFNESAVSIFYIYNAGASMPKYGGMGYYYACLDTGIMVELLTCLAEERNIGICSIGDMNFKKIESNFCLTDEQILIHTVELGLKK